MHNRRWTDRYFEYQQRRSRQERWTTGASLLSVMAFTVAMVLEQVSARGAGVSIWYFHLTNVVIWGCLAVIIWSMRRQSQLRHLYGFGRRSVEGRPDRVVGRVLNLLPPAIRDDAEALIRELVDVSDDHRARGVPRCWTHLKCGWYLLVYVLRAGVAAAFGVLVGRMLGH